MHLHLHAHNRITYMRYRILLAMGMSSIHRILIIATVMQYTSGFVFISFYLFFSYFFLQLSFRFRFGSRLSIHL